MYVWEWSCGHDGCQDLFKVKLYRVWAELSSSSQFNELDS